eukprot:1268939-Rhodomonas_salina.1
MSCGMHLNVAGPISLARARMPSMSVCRAERHWSAVAIRRATSSADALTSHTPIPKNISWLNGAFPVNVSLPQ